MKQLKGKTAIVTGASRGLGAHIARTLVGQGVNVVLVARSGDAIAKLAAELSVGGVIAKPLIADLLDLPRLGGVIDRAESLVGSIDILVNNAGIDGIRVYANESDAATEEMVRLNLLSPMILTRRILPKMLARKTGHIVNIASLAGKTSTPYNVSYATSKAGLVAFTHCLRSELRGTGVSASVVCPGFVTGEGMFALTQTNHGVVPNLLLGSSVPEQVAKAVVKTLRRDIAELPVNPGPMRLFQAIHQLTPGTVAWVQDRFLGVNAMLRKVALAQPPEPSAATSGVASGRPRRSSGAS